MLTNFEKKQQRYKIIVFLRKRVRHISTIVNPLFEQSPSYLELEEFKKLHTLLTILNDKSKFQMRTRFSVNVDRRLQASFNWENIDNPMLMREIVEELIELTNLILNSPDPVVTLGKDKISHRLFIKSINKQLKKLKNSLEGYTWPDELKEEIL